MILLIDCGSLYLKNIENVLDSLKIDYQKFSMENLNNININDFSAVIISGSPIMLAEPCKNHYIKQFDFLRHLDIPVLGICFGHQMIGVLFSAEISVGRRIKGMQKIEIIKDDELFKGIKHNSQFLDHHTEYISLPEDFILLAKSSTCEVEAMKHKNKKIYGVQFHPEVSGKDGMRLIRNFAGLLIEKK